MSEDRNVSVLKATGLVKEYIRVNKRTESNILRAVDTTDLEIRAGEVTVIRGRSGSGKTTLLNMLAGLLQPTYGSVYIDGKDIYAMSEEERALLRNEHIGIIPQGQSAIGSLAVMENILLPHTLFYKASDTGETENIEKKAVQLAERLGIADLADSMPNELSGGELKRMAIARALIKDPELIMADEPTGDLDDENTGFVLKLFGELAAGGTAVVMVTHEAVSEDYADNVYNMTAGSLVVEGGKNEK